MVEQVIQVAVHDLKRNSESFETVSGNAHLKVSETVERVVGELHAMYASRASKSHGRFAASPTTIRHRPILTSSGRATSRTSPRSRPS